MFAVDRQDPLLLRIPFDVDGALLQGTREKMPITPLLPCVLVQSDVEDVRRYILADVPERCRTVGDCSDPPIDDILLSNEIGEVF